MTPHAALVSTGAGRVAGYLAPGVAYGHIALKQAYYAACAAGMWCVEGDEHYRGGTAFREAVYALFEAGCIDMPIVTDRHGERTDFFAAVIDMYHHTHPKFRIVPGALTVRL